MLLMLMQKTGVAHADDARQEKHLFPRPFSVLVAGAISLASHLSPPPWTSYLSPTNTLLNSTHEPHSAYACMCRMHWMQDIVIPVMVTTQGFYLSPMNPRVEARAKKRNQTLARNGMFFFAVRQLAARNN